MGMAGWRFAHTKRNLSGRAAVVAVLEDWPAICSVMVAVGSMIMIGIMLYTICSSDHGWRALGADLGTDRDSAFTILRFCSTL